ncbi:Proprotein convertase P-domain protein [Phycisphaerae bacterium RAS1]|nr:Proprotein convertase P-domain protein [Phycisphaerae bacterium RAS1]
MHSYSSQPRSWVAAFFLALASASLAPAQVSFPEVEPNDDKPTATPITGPVAGDTIIGTSDSPAAPDYFRLALPAATPALYRHRLALTVGASSHTVSLRGLTQSNGVIGAAEAEVQASTGLSSPPHMVQWYGFGRGEQLYCRVTGSSAQSPGYVLLMATEVITPIDIGDFMEGSIELTTAGQGHSTDTDLWVYDANFAAVDGFGNDDALGEPHTQSRLSRFFSPGVYYIAVTQRNFANHLASPVDDDLRSGAVLDFPDAAASSSNSADRILTFAVTDSRGTARIACAKESAYEVVWAKMRVASVPFGPCCMPDGTCREDLTDIECLNAGGAPGRIGSLCQDISCTGRCCHPATLTCTQLSFSQCAAQNGIFDGVGTPCIEDIADQEFVRTLAPPLVLQWNGGVAVEDVLDVGDYFPIVDVDVSLLLAHTWQGDIDAVLVSPLGTSVPLISRPGVPQHAFGFSADDFGDVGGGVDFTLDDEAPIGLRYDRGAVPTPGIASVTGRWTPDAGALSAFDGQLAQGLWRLRITVNAAGDIGALHRWKLAFRRGEAPCEDPCNGHPGDLNCDGVVNILDINAFVLALADGGAYLEAYPTCCLFLADLNGDFDINVLDINPFITLLAGP